MKLFKTPLSILFPAFAMLALGACTNAPDATRVLEENGYTNVQITGYNWLSCSKDDEVHTGFIAKSPNGRTITGTVCAGLLFKNSTIRFE